MTLRWNGLSLISCGLICVACMSAYADSTVPIKIVLLGTGTPISSPDQFGPSVLVEAGGRPYVFDCGRGCGIRLNEVYGVKNMHKADTLFLTHLHSDHTVGIAEPYLNGWNHGRSRPYRVFGPSRTDELMRGLSEAYAADIELRSFELRQFGDHDKVAGSGVDVRLVKEGVVLEENGVRVTAFRVAHGHVKHAFGYRLEYGGKSVVISGDTAPTENLLRYAKGADVLIHEVMSPALIRAIEDRYNNNQSVVNFIVNLHTTARQASKIFSDARPDLAVFYHTKSSADGNAELLAETAANYEGRVVVATDLMTILVGDDVTVVE